MYTVSPRYEGNRTVPTGYDMSAYGISPDGSVGIDLQVFIPNELSTGDDLGTQTDIGGAPTPTGSTPMTRTDEDRMDTERGTDE
ncbi:hypothetical protein J7E88_28515 [Streptomyces sp. ISL-10]|uniref:hypothetical protein n=1 Tax=Streptomyces sp. ISL-10 TaxID=2819172 RepID=UPI001BEA918B|nr:hypothetical protein [Streptomyces sp. ISL-10]MBT2369153.1 hypothetical protein [Streptomyces sp. ISL-10]